MRRGGEMESSGVLVGVLNGQERVVVGGSDVSQLATLLVIVGRPFCIRIRELPPFASMTASKFEKAAKTHKVWFLFF